ncbi:MAG: phytanoyl-CoA dioxygenase family protein [Salinisphaera sp.]|uniref:phytanoyl-CoA dioxygenase family protein n=1 Tax=Salinisphaera sp. TaxID=1914330 RepID=UPI003C7B6263
MEFAQLTPGEGFLPGHSLRYYSQRLVTGRRTRSSIVRLLARTIRRRHGGASHNELTTEQRAALAGARRDGFVPLPALFDNTQIAEVQGFLDDKRLVARRAGASNGFTIANRPENVRIADYHLDDIVAAPHILELANSSFLLGIAEDYIGCKPTLSALGLRWSFPSERDGMGVQAFHRDADDWRHLKIFVYLTEVDEDAGPHVYVKRTHKDRPTVRLHEYSDAYIAGRYAPEDIVVVTGPAGFAFAANTTGVHKGTTPTRRPRLMLQIQYSLLPSYIYRYRPVQYRGPLMVDPYVNRLIVAQSTYRG